MAKGEEPIKLKAFHRNALQFFGITGGQRDGFPASTGLRSTLAFFGWGTRARRVAVRKIRHPERQSRDPATLP